MERSQDNAHRNKGAPGFGHPLSVSLHLNLELAKTLHGTPTSNKPVVPLFAKVTICG